MGSEILSSYFEPNLGTDNVLLLNNKAFYRRKFWYLEINFSTEVIVCCKSNSRHRKWPLQCIAVRSGVTGVGSIPSLLGTSFQEPFWIIRWKAKMFIEGYKCL